MEPCPTCGDNTIFDGIRRYIPPGFPEPHECEIKLYVPTENDFCTVCGGYGQGTICGDCQKMPVQEAVTVIATRVTRPQRQGLEL